MSNLDGLLLHPVTGLQIQNVLTNPPHAIMLTGPGGSGKSTLAKTLAGSLLEIKKTSLETYPYFIYVGRPKNKQEIAIEQIREIINGLKLKVPVGKKTQRVVFIEEAHFMSLPAQNALLKILEEPPAGVVFLLSATSAHDVLPTISSRTQVLQVLQVGLSASLAYWNNQYPDKTIESAWRLSGGCVGLLQALLDDDLKHPLKEAVEQARRFIAVKTYERLLIINDLSSNKEQLGLFIDALIRILNYLQSSAINSHKVKQSNNLRISRKRLLRLQKALANNSNAKLLALNLVLNLKV